MAKRNEKKQLPAIVNNIDAKQKRYNDLVAKCLEIIEQNNILCNFSKRKLKDLNLLDKSMVFNKNFLKHNLSDYDLVTLFQIPYIMPKLKSKLSQELKPNSLVCSYCFRIQGLNEIEVYNGWYVYKI